MMDDVVRDQEFLQVKLRQALERAEQSRCWSVDVLAIC